ncbi:OST-HTH/LOTUS domain-containing protein [Roseovarius litoreus]|uniref:OST-HTH/LOTUS domain-containing protein n=1 Tax=Roseovarius litoreus TaxID=1155722 RepID=A0A1M7LK29_9RHOB|nr:OST-HTH/LOTUS domain-containing protein [Roseovarius litoreus]SHM78389.1 OST-HTH/LOTUS domain-containing protein [Roseovarius litoreus]
MTTFGDKDLQTLQREVQRLLGRCLLRLQQYERLMKAVVVDHKLSGPMHDLETARAARIEDTALKTLGTLARDLLGSYLVAHDKDTAEETTTNPSENIDWFSMHITLGLSSSDLVQAENDLRDMVLLRNNLVHHFIDQHDLSSLDGCRRAQDALVEAYYRIDQHLGQLREWAGDMEEIRRVQAAFLLSEEFEDVFDNGIAPDIKVNWGASDIVDALREAYCALAAGGWASVAEAGRWIAKRNPEQIPANYGCNSWRQVVHHAPNLEIRYLEMNGKRTACYREKDVTAKSR